MTTSRPKVVLLAGPSGSGKSYIARRTGLPVLRLDDFYKDGDDPSLPRLDGLPNWESPEAWDSAAAIATIARLTRDGKAEVPVYAIGEDRRVASRTLDLSGSPLFIAEGMFAADIVPECRRLGLLADAYALRRSRIATFARRLIRDLAERRKAPWLLLRRGIALLRAEPAVLRRQTDLGARAERAAEIVRLVAAMITQEAATGPAPESPRPSPIGVPRPRETTAPLVLAARPVPAPAVTATTPTPTAAVPASTPATGAAWRRPV